MNTINFEQIIKDVNAIKNAHPENLMARHFSETYFRELDDQARQQLIKIISSGLQNPDSQVGAYAMAAEDYDLFSPLLDPMIRDLHSFPSEIDISPKHDWNANDKLCDLGIIDPRHNDVSMRVRVARNLSTIPLPGAMTKEQRLTFEDTAIHALKALINDPDFGGRYLSITPGSTYEIDTTEYQSLVDAHQMFKNMSIDPYLNAACISADWPYGRGIYISHDEDFLVWVGEEDHLRIMAMKNGSNLNTLFERLHIGLNKIEKLLPPFATSKHYGNVTSCPTNLGTAMRASLHMKFPALTSNGKSIERLKHKAKSLGLAVRGAKGEHSHMGTDGLVDISPIARLGVSEIDIMHCLYEGVTKLWDAEEKTVKI